MAHEQIRLVLLYPYPDTVHGNSLHKTLRSTSLTECGLPRAYPKEAFGSAVADCRYRAPLTPHLAQQIYCIPNPKILQPILREKTAGLFSAKQRAVSLYRKRVSAKRKRGSISAAWKECAAARISRKITGNIRYPLNAKRLKIVRPEHPDVALSFYKDRRQKLNDFGGEGKIKKRSAFARRREFFRLRSLREKN